MTSGGIACKLPGPSNLATWPENDMPRSDNHRKPPREPRYLASQGVELRWSLDSARLVDLGPSGLGIQTARPARPGSVHSFELETSHTAARLEGEVRWCHFAGTARNDKGDLAPVYRAGVRFTNGQPGNFLRILRSLALQRPAGQA